jgi:hypothetical protein
VPAAIHVFALVHPLLILVNPLHSLLSGGKFGGNRGEADLRDMAIALVSDASPL